MRDNELCKKIIDLVSKRDEAYTYESISKRLGYDIEEVRSHVLALDQEGYLTVKCYTTGDNVIIANDRTDKYSPNNEEESSVVINVQGNNNSFVNGRNLSVNQLAFNSTIVNAEIPKDLAEELDHFLKKLAEETSSNESKAEKIKRFLLDKGSKYSGTVIAHIANQFIESLLRGLFH